MEAPARYEALIYVVSASTDRQEQQHAARGRKTAKTLAGNERKRRWCELVPTSQLRNEVGERYVIDLFNQEQRIAIPVLTQRFNVILPRTTTVYTILVQSGRNNILPGTYHTTIRYSCIVLVVYVRRNYSFDCERIFNKSTHHYPS